MSYADDLMDKYEIAGNKGYFREELRVVNRAAEMIADEAMAQWKKDPQTLKADFDKITLKQTQLDGLCEKALELLKGDTSDIYYNAVSGNDVRIFNGQDESVKRGIIIDCLKSRFESKNTIKCDLLEPQEP